MQKAEKFINEKVMKDRISSNDFKEKLKTAIEQGIEIDHHWNEDNEEVQVRDFDSDISTDAVIKLLKKELSK